MKRTHLIAAASLALVASIALAGCSAKSSDSSPAGPSASSAPRGFAGGGPGAAPGVSGEVAQIDGSTAQVQSRQSQTAVSWTGSTRFTDQTAATAADVAVGDCIIARPRTSADGAGASTSSRTIAAATIEITPRTNGRCTVAGFGGRGVRPGIRPTAAPGGGIGGGDRSGSTPPAGARFSGAGFGAIGEVTAVGDGSYTVAVERFGRSGTATPGPSETPLTTSDTVTFTSDTVFTALKSADASAVKVGVCVAALGKTDDTGALSATSIAVSAPLDGTCSSGLGAGRGGTGGGSADSGSSNG
ncbi:DUF5666 domain-containing protein [Microbacterium sp.]|uniref:DUF5666 domain-containing protein n=1 Tax=Microbacterium sp. TaxID=51671 RepID=UPI00092AF2E1|nr:DUF5666 domain-containing protein [Microbacterium sp.]MBN9193097.1 hypothetical protein [Microbacterium sp.]OJU69245.1 MAG: hypothetical protein BGO04_00635 [Microbacterium sp. 70-38]